MIIKITTANVAIKCRKYAAQKRCSEIMLQAVEIRGVCYVFLVLNFRCRCCMVYTLHSNEFQKKYFVVKNEAY